MSARALWSPPPSGRRPRSSTGSPVPTQCWTPLWSGETAASGDRFRLFDAATRALTGLATGEPLLVVFDDLHRADEASLARVPQLMSVLDTESGG
ncbi:ATP-binding protein [Pseudonocardia saturnea]